MIKYQMTTFRNANVGKWKQLLNTMAKKLVGGEK